MSPFRREKDPYRNFQWKPEYDELAEYNRDRARGVVFEQWTVERMKLIQGDFDEQSERCRGPIVPRGAARVVRYERRPEEGP